MPDTLPINEIFESIQGEARFSGTPSVFLRLQACPVGCPWCDTKHTWDVLENNEISAPDMIAKTQDAPSFARMSVAEVVKTVKTYNARHVVITGGEPALYDLRPLTHALLENNFSVQLETSGTHEIRVAEKTFVTLSPKYDMPGGLKVLDSALSRANELKLPIGKRADVAELAEKIKGKHHAEAIWLQPLSRNPKATQICVDEAIARNWKVSVQIHAFLGLR